MANTVDLKMKFILILTMMTSIVLVSLNSLSADKPPELNWWEETKAYGMDQLIQSYSPYHFESNVLIFDNPKLKSQNNLSFGTALMLNEKYNNEINDTKAHSVIQTVITISGQKAGTFELRWKSYVPFWRLIMGYLKSSLSKSNPTSSWAMGVALAEGYWGPEKSTYDIRWFDFSHLGQLENPVHDIQSLKDFLSSYLELAPDATDFKAQGDLEYDDEIGHGVSAGYRLDIQSDIGLSSYCKGKFYLLFPYSEPQLQLKTISENQNLNGCFL